MRPIVFLTAITLCHGVGYAAVPVVPATDSVYIGYEDFRWREVTNTGFEVVDEYGPRYYLGLQENNFHGARQGLLYGLNAALWGGRVTYDGTTYDSVTMVYTPIQSTTDYYGGTASLSLGRRLAPFPLIPGLIPDYQLGVEGQYWKRDLAGGFNDLGQFAAGYSEYFGVANLRLSLGLYHALGRIRGYLRAGIKYPIYINEYVDNVDATLTPGALPSLYADYEIRTVRLRNRNGLSLRAFYNSYRFTASNVVNGVHQPESTMESVGLRLEYYLER